MAGVAGGRRGGVVSGGGAVSGGVAVRGGGRESALGALRAVDTRVWVRWVGCEGECQIRVRTGLWSEVS